MALPTTGPSGLWLAADLAEATAKNALASTLSPFGPVLENCYEAAVQAPTLPCKREGAHDLRAGALFLSRSLTDLRSTWLLLLSGYTPSAASVVAGLWEHSLAVSALVGNDSNTRKLLSSSDGDLPWKPQQLAKMHATLQRREYENRGEPWAEGDYEVVWRQIYAGYNWLCKIKHPTMPAALHSALSASAGPTTFVVMAAPDLRDEDQPVKHLLLVIAVSRISEACRVFANAAECATTTPEYQSFLRRLTAARDALHPLLDPNGTKDLPFTLDGTKWAKEYAEAKKRGKS